MSCDALDGTCIGLGRRVVNFQMASNAITQYGSLSCFSGTGSEMANQSSYRPQRIYPVTCQVSTLSATTTH